MSEYTKAHRRQSTGIPHNRTPAEVATDRIIIDLDNRSGIGDMWNGIDARTQAEIKSSWVALAESAYKDAASATISDALDLVVEAMCAHTGSSSPSKHHLDGGTIDWIARRLREGMSLPEAVADAWPQRDAAGRQP